MMSKRMAELTNHVNKLRDDIIADFEKAGLSKEAERLKTNLNKAEKARQGKEKLNMEFGKLQFNAEDFARDYAYFCAAVPDGIPISAAIKFERLRTYKKIEQHLAEIENTLKYQIED